MRHISIILYLVFILFLSILNVQSQTVWGINNSRTETRDDAGLDGNNGATSGFFQTSAPVNYPSVPSAWWHLLDVRHNNPTNNYAMQFAGSFYDQNLYFRKTSNNPQTSWSKILVETDGKVGIGITTPVTTLDVRGYVLFGRASGGPAMNITNLSDQDLQIHLTAPSAADKFTLVAPSTSTNLALGTGGTEKVRITNTGNFGIGTTTPQAKLDVNGSIYTNGKIAIGTTDVLKMAPYALAVAGNAIFNKVIVKIYSTWPDFVFHESYKMPSLRDLEQYIIKYKRLPEIPSATEVDSNGVDLGKNLTIILKKVEEMTLFLIDQNKKIEAQRKEIEILKRRNFRK